MYILKEILLPLQTTKNFYFLLYNHISSWKSMLEFKKASQYSRARA